MSLIIELDDHLAQAVREAAHREGVEPGALVRSVLEARVGEATTSAEAREKELLAAIGEGLPDPVWRRYHDLCERRRAGSLTDPEQEELIRLSDEVESWHARRLTLAAELSRLREEPFDDLMCRLGLVTPRA